MKIFEMTVNDVFYLADGRMVFSGQFVNRNNLHLTMNAAVHVNEKLVENIQLATLPFSSGKDVRKDLDVIEASKQIDLKFVDWKKDAVSLKGYCQQQLKTDPFCNCKSVITKVSTQ